MNNSRKQIDWLESFPERVWERTEQGWRSREANCDDRDRRKKAARLLALKLGTVWTEKEAA